MYLPTHHEDLDGLLSPRPVKQPPTILQDTVSGLPPQENKDPTRIIPAATLLGLNESYFTYYLRKRGAPIIFYVWLLEKLECIPPLVVRYLPFRLPWIDQKTIVNRSKMVAKQVISSRSALSLGFISQLWVDTNSWLVVVIEVRPSLLSGESERFLLDDVSQVGDVVLVPDESVMENEMKMIGLETLVGYDVVTEGQRNMGKVRGYTFDINTGAIESLELDSFGISIIPSTLVSTYSLFVEDVVEVEPDMVVVHESAASRIQRLTKGLWDTHLMGNSINDPIKDSDIESTTELDQKRNRKPTKLRKKWIDALDGLELPMDFL
ncbi:uncharacterized protein LOC124924491 [Impatiens glandulifera]|uniref:uncharacterized protein LOC124924491 n=1 Tax=Impatiens glandulifera TaxID=253017 RepID=UPI001FB17668|nr:uncharacterized protein LOC124924491 [Impatiens glandulifera]